MRAVADAVGRDGDISTRSLRRHGNGYAAPLTAIVLAQEERQKHENPPRSDARAQSFKTFTLQLEGAFDPLQGTPQMASRLAVDLGDQIVDLDTVLKQTGTDRYTNSTSEIRAVCRQRRSEPQDVNLHSTLAYGCHGPRI
jgi:hypothetical protein